MICPTLSSTVWRRYQARVAEIQTWHSWYAEQYHSCSLHPTLGGSDQHWRTSLHDWPESGNFVWWSHCQRWFWSFSQRLGRAQWMWYICQRRVHHHYQKLHSHNCSSTKIWTLHTWHCSWGCHPDSQYDPVQDEDCLCRTEVWRLEDCDEMIQELWPKLHQSLMIHWAADSGNEIIFNFKHIVFQSSSWTKKVAAKQY